MKPWATQRRCPKCHLRLLRITPSLDDVRTSPSVVVVIECPVRACGFRVRQAFVLRFSHRRA